MTSLFMAVLMNVPFFAASASESPWLLSTRARFDLHYAAVDRADAGPYEALFTKGVRDTETFFGAAYPKRFAVYIHPNRTSFDLALRKELHEPELKSECWLAGVGLSNGVQLLAPARWGDGDCEGRYTTYADKKKTQKFVTHELTH